MKHPMNHADVFFASSYASLADLTEAHPTPRVSVRWDHWPVPVSDPGNLFRHCKDLSAGKEESRVKLEARHWWLVGYAQGRATVGREFPPRHTKPILLKTQQRLFSILHCCKHAMQEQSERAYWQLCIDPWLASGGRRFESDRAKKPGFTRILDVRMVPKGPFSSYPSTSSPE